MKFIDVIRRYRRRGAIIKSYESRMLNLYQFEKYKRAGKLLLASAAPGDVVFLIAETDHIADLFNEIRICRVLDVQFVGKNNAILHLQDVDNGRAYTVRNSDMNKIFFHDINAAQAEKDRREAFLIRKWG